MDAEIRNNVVQYFTRHCGFRGSLLKSPDSAIPTPSSPEHLTLQCGSYIVQSSILYPPCTFWLWMSHVLSISYLINFCSSDSSCDVTASGKLSPIPLHRPRMLCLTLCGSFCHRTSCLIISVPHKPFRCLWARIQHVSDTSQTNKQGMNEKENSSIFFVLCIQDTSCPTPFSLIPHFQHFLISGFYSVLPRYLHFQK